MPKYELFGNDYDKTIESSKPETHVFDRLECAIHALAPTCEHCCCRVIGHVRRSVLLLHQPCPPLSA